MAIRNKYSLLSSILIPALFSGATVSTKAETTTPENPDTAQLDKVTVTAEEETPDKISAKKLLRVPGSGNDPMRAIESLPGVVIGNGRSAAPAVRGSSPDDNSYIIDFIPVNNLFHLDGSSIVNDNFIESFDLYTSGYDAKYPEATGAVIETTTRAPFQDDSQVVIDFSLVKAGLMVEAPITENLAGFFSFRQSLFQYYIENFLDEEDFKFTTVPEYFDYQGKLQYNLNATDTLSFQIIGSDDKAGILFADDSDEVKKDPGLKGGFSFNSYFHSQAIVWDRLIGDGTTHTTSFSHMKNNFNFAIGTKSKLDAIAHDYIVKSHVSQPLSFDHTLRYGVELTKRDIEFDGRVEVPNCTELDNPQGCRLVDAKKVVTTEDKPTIMNYDAFIADDWQITNSLLVTPGVLVSYDDYTKQSFAQPKLSARWEFTDQWWLNTSGGKYHKFPENFREVAKGFGNPDLKQPTSNHFAVGVENRYSDSLLWKIDTYYKTFDDLIVGDDVKNFVNDADGYAYGMELFINKTLTDSWYGWMSVVYAETHRERKSTGEKFRYAYDQPWTVNLVSSHEITEEWTLGFKWRYSSGQLYTPVLSATQDAKDPELYNPTYGDLNSERFPDYHKLDVRLDRNYQFTDWEMDLYLEMLNAYNRKNVTDYEYSPDYKTKEAESDLPLIVSFGIKATF